MPRGKHPKSPQLQTSRTAHRETLSETYESHHQHGVDCLDFHNDGGILLRHLNTLDRGVRPEAPFARVLIYGLFHLPSELFSQRSHLEPFEPRVDQVGLTRTLGEYRKRGLEEAVCGAGLFSSSGGLKLKSRPGTETLVRGRSLFTSRFSLMAGADHAQWRVTDKTPLEMRDAKCFRYSPCEEFMRSGPGKSARHGGSSLVDIRTKERKVLSRLVRTDLREGKHTDEMFAATPLLSARRWLVSTWASGCFH